MINQNTGKKTPRMVTMPIGHLPEVAEAEVIEVTGHRLAEEVHPEAEVVTTNREVEQSTANPEVEEAATKVVEVAMKVAEEATIEAAAKPIKAQSVPWTNPLGNGVTKTRNAQSLRK